MKRRRAVKVLFVATVLVVAGVWIFAARLGLTSAHAQLEAEVAAARKEGLPLTEADLHLPNVPDDQNAAQIIFNSDGVIKGLPGHPDSVLVGYPKSPVSPAQLDRAIADLQPIYDMAAEAAARPHLDFHWHYHSFRDDEGGLDKLKRLVRLLAQKADRATQKGEIRSSLESLGTAARLSAHVSELPTLFSMLVRLNSEKLVLASGANLIRADHSPTTIASLRKILYLLGPTPNLKRALQCEFVIEQGSIGEMAYADEHLSCDRYDCDYVPPEWKLMRVGQIADLNRANHIAFSRRRISAAPDDINLLNRSVGAQKAIDDDASSATGLGNMAVQAFFPTWNQMTESVLENVAARRVFAAGLDILSLPKLPATWSKAGYDGIDPLMDRPLTYRRTKDGFVVYSLGRDRKDDGGLPYSYTQTYDAYDISFEYPKLSVKPAAKSAPRMSEEHGD